MESAARVLSSSVYYHRVAREPTARSEVRVGQQSFQIRTLEAIGVREIRGLAEVLLDCVHGGASVSFMLPMTLAKAEAFWRSGAMSVAREPVGQPTLTQPRLPRQHPIRRGLTNKAALTGTPIAPMPAAGRSPETSATVLGRSKAAKSAKAPSGLTPGHRVRTRSRTRSSVPRHYPRARS